MAVLVRNLIHSLDVPKDSLHRINLPSLTIFYTAMLASVGAFTAQYGLVIPGYTGIADPVENLNNFVLDWPLGFSQIILAIGIIEGHFFPGEFWFGKGDREAGNLGYDPLGFFKNKTPAQKDDMRLKELKNGRLAMMAMAAYTAGILHCSSLRSFLYKSV